MKIYYNIINKSKKEINMALDKTIESGKEHRKPYTKSKAIDKTCRNHGSCLWCYNNRAIKNLKELEKTLDKLKEW